MYCYFIIICLMLFLCLVVYFYREKEVIKHLALEAALKAEEAFNSGEGQAKLDYAVEYIKRRLPIYLRFIVTKYVLVTIIEKILIEFAEFFGHKVEINIIGNETTTDVNIDKTSLTIESKKSR